MTGWVDMLLGLGELSLSDAGVVLGWRDPLPAYVWAAVVLGALGYAGWSYSGLLGSRPMRIALACVRALWIVLLALLLAGPMLIKPGQRVEPDWLLVLVDRSASMTIPDMWNHDASDGSPQVLTRDAQVRQALANQVEAFGAKAMGPHRQVVWMGFGEQAFALDPPARLAHWDAPTQVRTGLRTAIEQALALASGHPISAVVLITDGRSPQATDVAWTRQLQQRAVRVYPVPVGSKQMPLDFSVVEVDAPRQAFINDQVPIHVQVQSVGGDGQPIDRARVTLSLIDQATGETIDQTTWDTSEPDQPVKLIGRSSQVGQAQWKVRVDAGDDVNAGQPERIIDNNEHLLSIQWIDRPIRVLYVEGYPRWEYRYLKNMLMREKSIATSILLLSADRHFVQEGDVPITRLPQTRAEMDDYDVIIVGDVPPETFSAKQLALLRDHVATHGAGLLWIGGERATPARYDGSPLASLMPMRQPAQVSSRYQPVQLHPTALAQQLQVLQLQVDALPDLHWHQALGALKPTAEVLATTSIVAPASPSASDAPPADALPMVTRLRYGAGQSLYVGTDETWRWRYGRGELFFERFWIQLVRMLGRDRVAQVGQRAQLSLSHPRLGVDETVTIQWTTDDAALMALKLPSLAVTVTRQDDPSQAIVDELTLRLAREQEPGDAILAGDAPTKQIYVTTWQPASPGRFLLRIVEPALDDLDLRAELEVVAPDDELRDPTPDHERLVALAQQTGGQIVPLDALHTLAGQVPNRSIKTPDDQREPLWHAPVMLGLLVLLLTLEWIGRKMIRLV